MHGEVEYFSANSMYAADQAGLRPFAPYVEALDGSGRWVRVVDDLVLRLAARTMTADLSGKLPVGTRRIRLTTNLQIYWDGILISRTAQDENAGGPRASVSSVPLVRATLGFHGFPLKIEDWPPGNVKYIYEKTSVTGPYSRPAGAYTRYGDVLAAANLRTDDRVCRVWIRRRGRAGLRSRRASPLRRSGCATTSLSPMAMKKIWTSMPTVGTTVEPLPFREMRGYPYPGQTFRVIRPP